MWKVLCLAIVVSGPSVARAGSPKSPDVKRFRLPAGFMGGPTPHYVFVDDEYVFCGTGSSAQPLFRMPRPGGPLKQLLPRTNAIISTPLLVKGRILLEMNKKIVSLSRDGGKPRVEFDLPDTLSLYSHDGRLYRTKFRGRVIELLEKGRKPRAIARFPRSPGNLTFDGRHIYTQIYARGLVVRVPLKGGKMKILARGQRKAVASAVLGRHVYWVVEGRKRNTDEVRRRLKTGRGAIETIARAQYNAEVFVVHDGKLYWRDWSGAPGQHKIWRYDPTKKELLVAVGGLKGPSDFTFDSQYIYICEKGTHSIVRAPKR
jgi:hypothetical protein